jgi:hypothetical protein
MMANNGIRGWGPAIDRFRAPHLRRCLLRRSFNFWTSCHRLHNPNLLLMRKIFVGAAPD